MTDSDTESTSSGGGIFESNEPFVLELHDLKKDEPNQDAVATSQNIKRKKKEKRKKVQDKKEKDKTSTTSSSLSDSIPALSDEANKEEFYDARESYYALASKIRNIFHF